MKTERLVLGLALLNLGFVSCMSAGAQEVPAVVRAKALEIVDDGGKVRAQINVEATGEVVLRMRDPSGALRVKLGTTADGSGLVLNNDASEPGLQALAVAAGTTVRLHNKDGKETLIAP